MITDKRLLTRRRFLRLSMTGAAAAGLSGLSLSLPAWALDNAGDAAHPVPGHKPRAPRLLMIDPGHGGHDPGAIGISGTYEKEVTLDIARHMADALSGKPGVTAKLTRDSDTFIPLEERVSISREARADMFISVHADSAPDRTARGLSLYTLSQKGSDAFARSLAQHENEADLMGGVDVPSSDKEVNAILYDLASRRTHNTSLHVKSQFADMVGKQWRLLDNPQRAANFVVLRAPDVPSMLVETGFLSNAQDERILSLPTERMRIARLMAKSLEAILDGPLFG
ncbi:MAG: N-acetylmuramoyl-L-alanine amidase [Alphaproteobacteria bacterium]|nr:N-acetylmuramoyl-L-alanine amidase [Alphaproteobacteria bacterium]MBV8548087.1 N-acetylmuramoyl-L-alanine amidase [Alphaproteobacteria bacterium]